MAHKYANFDAAYSDFAGKYSTVKQYYDWGWSNVTIAYTGCSDPVDKLHYGYLCYATQCLFTSYQNLADLLETTFLNSHLYESIYWAAQQGGGGAVTMDNILNAMLAADFNDLQEFIGIVDAYRTAIWNAPFNSEYYAAIARGFQKWPKNW